MSPFSFTWLDTFWTYLVYVYMWYIHVVEYYSSLKKEGNPVIPTTYEN